MDSLAYQNTVTVARQRRRIAELEAQNAKLTALVEQLQQRFVAAPDFRGSKPLGEDAEYYIDWETSTIDDDEPTSQYADSRDAAGL